MKSRIAGFAEFAKAGEPITGRVLVYEDTEGQRLNELMELLSAEDVHRLVYGPAPDVPLMPPEGDKEQ